MSNFSQFKDEILSDSEPENNQKAHDKTDNTAKTPINENDLTGFGSFGGFDTRLDSKSGNIFQQRDEPQAFPIEAFPESVKNMAVGVSGVAQVPLPLSAVTALACISASIGGSLKVNSGGERTTQANLYFLGVAKSGVGKGQVFSYLSKPISDYENEALDIFNENILPSLETDLEFAEEAFKEAKKKKDRETAKDQRQLIKSLEVQIKSPPRIFCEDITREALTSLLASQKGSAIASFSSEARGLIGILNGRYSGGKSDEDLYCKCYSGDEITVNRLSRGDIKVKRPCLSLCWLMQPDAAKELTTDSSMVESGLIPRILMFNSHAERREEPETPLVIDQSAKHEWGDICTQLLSLRNNPEEYTVQTTPEAHKTIVSFTNLSLGQTMIGGELTDLGSFAARYGENTWKIALCLHAAEHGENSFRYHLSEETAKNAISIMKWFIPEQLAFLSEQRFNRKNEDLERLATYFRGIDKSEATLRNIKRNTCFKSDSEIEQLARDHPMRFRIEIRTSGEQGGRPSRNGIWIS